MHRLSKIELCSEAQVAFGNRLGLDLGGKSVGVARAEISDMIATDFDGVTNTGAASPKQLALAQKFGIDISRMSKAAASAVIDDIMYQLNMEAIEAQKLAPGVRVRRTRDPGRTFIISSITPDGTVYFKGGNGQRAWSRSLERE
jgi:hypothetical protein